MTLVKNITFPNAPLTAYEADPEQWDTEVVQGATGTTFRNGRRTVSVWYCKLTLFDTLDSDAVTAALAVKSAAEGQVYGFKFTCREDGVTRDVAFKQDTWSLKFQTGAPALPSSKVTIDVELEEVLNGVPAP
jgi:hypothetical protein